MGVDLDNVRRWAVLSVLCLAGTSAAAPDAWAGGPAPGKPAPGWPAPAAPAAGVDTRSIRVAIDTDRGRFRAELFPGLAPDSVRLFLARAVAAAAGEVSPYAGTQVCEIRGSVHIVFGCQAFENSGPKPVAARRGPQAPDEIDGHAMGLDGRLLLDMKDVHALWQLEMFPRYAALEDAGRPVPPRLAALVEEFLARGSSAETALLGRSRLWYLETIGFAYTKGCSPLRVTRGALASFTMWPGDADERFLVALDDLSERDGRATVFGRVIDGWDTLDRIQRIPTDRARRPEQAVRIERIEIEPGVFPASGAVERERNPGCR